MLVKKIKILHITGCVFTVLAGSLLHFVYEWTGESRAAAIFCAVNESTWEHLKLLFWPVILFGLLEWAMYGLRRCDFIYVKMVSLLLGLFTVTAVFYTYAGILGKNYLPLDILTFAVGTSAAYRHSYIKMIAEDCQCVGQRVTGIAIFILLLGAFLTFTFYPPPIGLFLDPVTGGYGI